jgi:anti-sigma factor RsiW
MSEAAKITTCEEVLDLLYLYACEELDAHDQELVTAHIEVCSGCRKALAEHRVLRRALPGGFARRRLRYYSHNN